MKELKNCTFSLDVIALAVQTQFIHIKEFSLINKTCLFCKSKMDLSLSNRMGHPGGVQALSAKCINDLFTIPIFYGGGNLQVSGKGNIGIKTNKIFFDIDDYHGSVHSVHTKAASVFEKLSLHLSLNCSNNICNDKYNYYICTSQLKCLNKNYNHNSIQRPIFDMAPYNLYMESFVYDKKWIQNLWIENTTCIYSVEKYDEPPIEMPLIDWSEMSINKIASKISTLITFS